MRIQKFSLYLLQFTFGWFFLYTGITKVLDPSWTSAGYLNNAQTFSGFYHFLARPEIVNITDFINEWGLTLLGISLLTGILVRWSSYFGILLMMLYFFPILDFPLVGKHSYLVDEHIIYASVLLLFATLNPRQFWGIGNWFRQST
jgi:thiosulfate dehydrogenase (quinone) large subunit